MGSYTEQMLAVQTRYGLQPVYEARPADHIRTRGSVFFVSGLLMSTDGFAELVPHLTAAGYRVYTYDQLDLINTAGGFDLGSYPMETLAEDLRAVIDTVAGAGVHLIGHALGGLMARAATLLAPEGIGSLTLLGSGPSGETSRYADLLDWLGDGRPTPASINLWEAIRRALARNGIEDQHLVRLTSRLHVAKPPLLVGLGKAYMLEPNRTAELRAARVPTFVLHGMDGGAWSPLLQESMSERLGAERAVLRATGPTPYAVQPVDASRLLTAHWRKCEESRQRALAEPAELGRPDLGSSSWV